MSDPFPESRSMFEVGLGVVRRLVEEHGASVLGYDVRGGETIVDLRIPIAPFARLAARFRVSTETTSALQENAWDRIVRVRTERMEQQHLLALMRDLRGSLREQRDELARRRRHERERSFPSAVWRLPVGG